MQISAMSCVRGAACLVLSLVVSVSYGQLSPEEELKTLRAAEGLEVSLFASEPMITNPSCIDIDSQGRVWVAEIQFYRKSAKNPPADKIKVLEDTDHDGRADKVTVFADGIFAPMSLCVCGDKVYAFVQGDLLVWEDKNGDLVADGPPKKLIEGFSKSNHDHTAHSIVVGPDHKWYMAHGDTGFNATGTDGSKIEYRFGAMVRGELDGSKLETIAVNFRNPYEICVNSFGESFCSDNDNDGNESVRICWILEGGNYGWNGGPPFKKEDLTRLVPDGTPFREAWHFRGYIPGNVPGTLVTGFGSPTGICIYESDAIASFKNAPLHTDCGPGVLRAYPHQPAGAGMKATSETWLQSDGDKYFRPDDVCVAPDGSVLVSDWYDGGVGGHAYNNPNQGRIFLVKPKDKKLARKEKPGPYTNIADAIEGLQSPNHATQFLARERLLAEGEKSVPALKSLLASEEPNNRARALWLLDRIGGSARDIVVEQLKSADPAFRALAVRILRRHGDEYAGAILPLANDSSGEVRREVILACGKITGDKAFQALVSLTATYDGTDRYLLEAINIAAGDRREQLYAALEKSGRASFAMLPMLQLLDPRPAAAMLTAKLNQPGLDPTSLRVLIFSAGNIPTTEAGRAVMAILANKSIDKDSRLAALGAIVANLDSTWSGLAEDPSLRETFNELLIDPDYALSILNAVQTLSLKDFSDRVKQIAVGGFDNNVETRCQAMHVLARLRVEGSGDTLKSLLNDQNAEIRQTALRALVDSQELKTVRRVLTDEKISQDMRNKTMGLLMETTGGSMLLLRMVDTNELASANRDTAIALATAHPDTNVRTLFEKFIPEEKRPKKLGGAVKPAEILALKGDATRGEEIFKLSSAAQCKSCHRVYGDGGNIGPDLSTIGSKYERAALLETILEPSKAISHEYRAQMVQTSEGQVFVGFLTEKSDKRIVLRDIKGKLIKIPANEVEAIVEQEKSLMPELVLQEVTAQDAADLLAFLTTLVRKDEPISSTSGK